jgi:hypothetical protein
VDEARVPGGGRQSAVIVEGRTQAPSAQHMVLLVDDNPGDAKR